MMENTLENRKNQNKDSIIFVATLVFLFLLFSQANLFMNSVMNEGGKFYNAFIAQHFDYIQALKTALIVPAVFIIKLFGFHVIYNHLDVLVVGGPHLRISYSCLGLGVMSFLAAFIIAFPAKVKAKIQLLLFSFILIYLLNVLRIAGLGILLGYFKSQRKNFTYHHEIFNILVYLIIFLVLYLWVKKNTTLIPTQKTEPNLD